VFRNVDSIATDAVDRELAVCIERPVVEAAEPMCGPIRFRAKW